VSFDTGLCEAVGLVGRRSLRPGVISAKDAWGACTPTVDQTTGRRKYPRNFVQKVSVVRCVWMWNSWLSGFCYLAVAPTQGITASCHSTHSAAVHREMRLAKICSPTFPKYSGAAGIADAVKIARCGLCRHCEIRREQRLSSAGTKAIRIRRKVHTRNRRKS